MQCHAGERGGAGRRPGRILRRSVAALAALGLMCGMLTFGPVHAQVSSDGDIRPIHLRTWGGWLGKDAVKGAGVVWQLGTKSAALATIVVTGDDGLALPSQSELHFTPKDLGHRLSALLASGEALFFRRVPGDGAYTPPPPSLSMTHRLLPRLFVIEKRPVRLQAEPKRGIFLFHLESRARTPSGERIDHFLVIDVSRDDGPHIEWYVDSRSEQMPFGIQSDAVDRRWGVEPSGEPLGLLTPVREAVAHRLAPVKR